MSQDQPASPRLSAATILIKPNPQNEGFQVLMALRSAQSDFAPAVYVFPGGAVTESDKIAEVTPGVCYPAVIGDETSLGNGVRVAAIRELYEEAGILLAKFGDPPTDTIDDELSLRLVEHRKQLQTRAITMLDLAAAEDLTFTTDLLYYFAHWITPEVFPKRFNTYFFITTAPESQTATHDNAETTDSIWISPQEALERYEHNDFPLVYATEKQLQQLALFPTAEALFLSLKYISPPVIMPRVITHNGKQLILMPDEQDPK